MNAVPVVSGWNLYEIFRFSPWRGKDSRAISARKHSLRFLPGVPRGGTCLVPTRSRHCPKSIRRRRQEASRYRGAPRFGFPQAWGRRRDREIWSPIADCPLPRPIQLARPGVERGIRKLASFASADGFVTFYGALLNDFSRVGKILDARTKENAGLVGIKAALLSRQGQNFMRVRIETSMAACASGKAQLP